MKPDSIPLTMAFRQFAPLRGAFVENRWGLAAGFLSLLIVDGLQLIIPIIIKNVVDALTVRDATNPMLLVWGLWIVGIAGGMTLFRYLWRYFLMGHARRIERDLRARLFAHLQTLPASYYMDMPTGDLMARTINDLGAVRMATGVGLAAFTDGLVMGLAAMGFMVAIDWRLALITLIPAPFVILFSRIYTRRMAVTYERLQKRFGSMSEKVREAFAGVRVIKAYGREDWAAARLRGESRAYVRENLDLARHLGIFFPMMMIFTNLGLAIVIAMGGRMAVLGDISTGDFVAFGVYLNLLTWPMMAMGWVTNLLQRGGAAMRRINQVLETAPAIVSFQDADAPPARGDIRFSGLTFRYPGTEAPVLEGLSLALQAGTTLALVGGVGCGKTTLLSLLPRLWDPPAGTVFLDGLDVRRYGLQALRGRLGFVTQEPVIFSDTIFNNVAFERPGVTRDQARDALARARFLDDVLAMENGMDTLLGERGITLSGGQRQRLTIARALVENPPVLVLDDALSMVDTRTEEAIVNGVLESRSGKTTIIVSHRSGTLRRAGLIAVLDQGRIRETGTHESLMRDGTVYQNLYQEKLLREKLAEDDF